MSAIFPPAPQGYERANEVNFRERVRALIDGCFNRGQDVEIGAGRLILKDTVTGTRYNVTMVSGTLTTTAL